MGFIQPLNIFTGAVGLLTLPLWFQGLPQLSGSDYALMISVIGYLVLFSVTLIVFGVTVGYKWRPSVAVSLVMIFGGILAILSIPFVGWIIGPLAMVSGAMEGSAAMGGHITV